MLILLLLLIIIIIMFFKCLDNKLKLVNEALKKALHFSVSISAL